jgi:SAM-dependent methyltransferase
MSEKCLVIGCGNSAFSSDLYDHGFKHITNVDFSEQVIELMKSQNLQRSEMSWEVMDMTALTYQDESYDVVLDKGALDALMSANTPQAKAQAEEMFQSILRVLKDNGRYVCITLAEDYIVEQLLGFFNLTMSLTVQIHTIQTDSPSPFKTFVIILTKKVTDQPIEIFFDTFGVPLPSQQKVVRSLPETLEMVFTLSAPFPVPFPVYFWFLISLVFSSFTKSKLFPRNDLSCLLSNLQQDSRSLALLPLLPWFIGLLGDRHLFNKCTLNHSPLLNHCL